MKIELTEEQSAKMALVFKTLDELRKDKKFMKLMAYAQSEECSEDKITEDNEDAFMRLINFHEDLRDYANNYFNFIE